MVLDLPTPEGWKAELTQVTCYIPRWFTRPQTVTHPSTNLAQRRLTTSIKADALTTTLCRQPVKFYPNHLVMLPLLTLILLVLFLQPKMQGPEQR